MKIKKIISSLFLASMALFSFNACSDVPNPYDIPEIGDSSIYGTGTMQNPYVVKGAALNQNGKLAWVKAYITGYIPSGGDAGSTISDAVFGTEGAGESNIVVSATPDNKNINNCLAVQLPIGEIRDSLNLSSHPQNLYQEVMLLGTMVNYYGGSGVRNVQAYIMNGDTIGEIPVTTVFSETFDSNQGEFTIENKILPEDGSAVWTWENRSGNSYMKATSFKTDGFINYPAESWLISPEIDLTKAENATLTFERVLYKVNNITIWAKESGSENWSELDMPNKKVTTSWNFEKSGDINLNNYKGKKIQIAFKYLATNQAGTFELKNFTIEDRVAGKDDPILEESFNNTFGNFTPVNISGTQEWKPNNYNNNGYVSMSAYSSGKSFENEDWLVSPAIDLSKEHTLTFEHAMGPKNQDLSNAPEQYTVWVSTDYNGDVTTATWTQVNITYPATSGWTFETVTTKLPAVGAKAYFAFKYKNAENANTITWEIKNLSVK